MNITDTAIPDVKLLTLKGFADSRGVFCETYNLRRFQASGIDVVFVQDNHSTSKHIGTVRGLHFQTPPFAQDKLVRVLRGAILDVVVDIRRGSPSYGRHVAVELRASDWSELFVPIGFAHGFCTLEPDTEVLYKVSNYYAPEHDRGLLWSDPALGIAWPVAPESAHLSDKDQRHPVLADIGHWF